MWFSSSIFSLSPLFFEASLCLVKIVVPWLISDLVFFSSSTMGWWWWWEWWWWKWDSSPSIKKKKKSVESVGRENEKVQLLYYSWKGKYKKKTQNYIQVNFNLWFENIFGDISSISENRKQQIKCYHILILILKVRYSFKDESST